MTITPPTDDAVSIALFLDNAPEAFARYRPPAEITLDTTQLDDGPHVLRIEAVDANGAIGRRTIRFVVANGPGISVTGLRDGKVVAGQVDFNVNAFGGAEPFDVSRAESQNPIPVWVWVLITTITAWAGWYGIEQFAVPASLATTPTYASNPALAALAPAVTASVPVSSGRSLAGFDYGASGAAGYAANCSACHGAAGAGVPGAFPSLVHDPVVLATSPEQQISIVLHGLHGKVIGGTAYTSQMPNFSHLDDATIAAIIDHERTSWGNVAPTIVPSDVKRAR
jgi:mono/diheme cytochrome c family protein